MCTLVCSILTSFHCFSFLLNDTITIEALLTKTKSGEKLKVIRNYENDMEKLELYDLDADPSETNNIAKTPIAELQSTRRRMLQKLTRIGPCPNDEQGRFAIQNMELKNTPDNMVSCEWFKRRPYRCNKYIEGEIKCRSVCGRHNKICQGVDEF